VFRLPNIETFEPTYALIDADKFPDIEDDPAKKKFPVLTATSFSIIAAWPIFIMPVTLQKVPTFTKFLADIALPSLTESSTVRFAFKFVDLETVKFDPNLTKDKMETLDPAWDAPDVEAKLFKNAAPVTDVMLPWLRFLATETKKPNCVLPRTDKSDP
jgi:hypothetical protein